MQHDDFGRARPVSGEICMATSGSVLYVSLPRKGSIKK